MNFFCENSVARYKKGFSIIEVISAIFIFSIITVTLYGSFKAGLQSLAQSKHRIAAAELANEKMEIIRNLPYESVGTEGGIPSGSLPQNETVWKSNQRFNVRTTIIYSDDPLDGLEGGTPEDDVPTDYKRIRIEVIWAGVQLGKGVVLVSSMVPNGVETDSGGGTLRINVIDSTGVGVSGADTHIVNTSSSPNININVQTDLTGSILMAGMPVEDQTYEISVSKSDYESISTFPPYPTTSYEPVDIHGSVVEGTLNSKTIIMDKLGDMSFVSKDVNDQPIPNVNFNLNGGRILGQTVVESPEIPQIVYSYDADLETDSQGTYALNDISPGNYNLTLTESGYTLIGTETPLLPFTLAPAQELSLTLILADNDTSSLITKIRNSDTGERLNGASVRLYNTSDFDQTLVTGESGQVYFPATIDPPVTLEAEEYNLEVSAEEFQSYSGTVTINQLTQQEISLIPL